jgi:DNA-binding winged helix-turn-helix (wHTH) protein
MYIQTIPRRGYRFVGNVSVAPVDTEELSIEVHQVRVAWA